MGNCYKRFKTQLQDPSPGMPKFHPIIPAFVMTLYLPNDVPFNHTVSFVPLNIFFTLVSEFLSHIYTPKAKHKTQ